MEAGGAVKFQIFHFVRWLYGGWQRKAGRLRLELSLLQAAKGRGNRRKQSHPATTFPAYANRRNPAFPIILTLPSLTQGVKLTMDVRKRIGVPSYFSESLEGEDHPDF